ncbi:MAG: hypothetical protein LBI57_05790 [Helicobacteraceae bacterium]|jgi:septum formation inhibitor MinC|nr:hypothetical protein [Helicobacteraceae bacterium]
MKVKQIGLRCFEFAAFDGEAEAAQTYIKTHEAILNRYMILLSGDYDRAIDETLRESGLTYAWTKRDHALFSKPATSETPPQVSYAAARKPATLVTRKQVRSGERVGAEGDAIFLGRINSGAEIFALGNCFIFAPLYGLCNVQGDFAVVTEVGKGGLFIFKDVVYESAFFDGPKRFIALADSIIAEEHL